MHCMDTIPYAQNSAVPAENRSATLAKGLRLLNAILVNQGHDSLTAIAAREAIPLPTAHRLAATLEAAGFLERARKGYFHAGPALRVICATDSPARRAAARLRRPLAQLALRHGIFAHFGVLEDGMVTYLVKERGGSEVLFTAEHMQLEAYCSAIGKVLLATLPRRELDAYLANGPFVPLTRQTITDPVLLGEEIATVRRDRIGFDRFEIREDLFCVAVPVANTEGQVLGGISASFVGQAPDAAMTALVVQELRRTARSFGRNQG